VDTQMGCGAGDRSARVPHCPTTWLTHSLLRTLAAGNLVRTREQASLLTTYSDLPRLTDLPHSPAERPGVIDIHQHHSIAKVWTLRGGPGSRL